MRYPTEHKRQVRSRIVAAASRALRRRGLTGVSIPALMEQAGLTHGGFYGHFRSRDALVAEAVAFAAEETGAKLFGTGSGGVDQMLATYLSPQHVDDPAGGCVLAALGAEAGHQRPAVRRAFAQTSRGFLAHLERKLRGEPSTGRVGDDTLALAVRMIGGVVVARLVGDERLAKRVLAVARQGEKT